MTSPATNAPAQPAPLVLDPKWKMVPFLCIGIGVIGAIAGLASDGLRQQFVSARLHVLPEHLPRGIVPGHHPSFV
jgi:hypothetical protein